MASDVAQRHRLECLDRGGHAQSCSASRVTAGASGFFVILILTGAILFTPVPLNNVAPAAVIAVMACITFRGLSAQRQTAAIRKSHAVETIRMKRHSP
jgi:hypothetical protein